MSIASIQGKKILLDSGMTESAFGKTSYESIVTQEGMLCDGKRNGSGMLEFTFTPWSFSEINALDTGSGGERTVFYCGSSSGFTKKARPLNELIEDEETSFTAGLAYCALLTQAAKQEISLPQNGAGGVIAEISEKKIKLLLLPEQLFRYSAGARKKEEEALLRGCWINPSLDGIPSLCFERAVTAYRIITGKFPYPQTDQTERNADILDRNFIPVELCVNGLDSSLAEEINRGLRLNANVVSIPGKKQQGKTWEELSPRADFPLERLHTDWSSKKITRLTEDEYQERTQGFKKQQTARISAKRKLRRNKAAILTVLAVVLVAGYITYKTVQGKLDDATTRGLSSVQVVESFYKGVNDKDTILLGDFTHGKKMNRFTDPVSQIYVISKQRQTYNSDQGYLSPEGWLLYNTDATRNLSSGVYGVSNVRIDGRLSDLNPPVIKRKDKAKPVTAENGITIKDKDKSVHKAEYYLLHSEGEESELQVEQITELVTLTYLKDRWLITDIDSESRAVRVNSARFKTEYYARLAQDGADIIEVCRELRAEYPWIPEANVIKREYDKLQDIVKDPFSRL